MTLTDLMKIKNEDLIEQIVRLMKTDDATDAPPDSLRWAGYDETPPK